VEDVQAEQIGDMVDVEMQMTSQAIEEATAKIAVCLCVLIVILNHQIMSRVSLLIVISK